MKENVFPSDFPQTKKQVRFNTSKMSSPSDHQLPRPLIDIQNINYNDKQSQDFSRPAFHQEESKKSSPFIQDSVYVPPRVFDKEISKTSPTFSLPKPSEDLELSILDSSDVFTNMNDRFQNKGDQQMIGLGVKMYENDMPYCFPPSKMPIHSVYNQTPSEKLFNLNPGLLTSAAQSKKDFCLEKPDTDPALGFFTIPNSGGLYNDKKMATGPSHKVAIAKTNLATQNTRLGMNPQYANKENFISGLQNAHSQQTARQRGPFDDFNHKLAVNTPSYVTQKQISTCNLPLQVGSYNLNSNQQFNGPNLQNLQRQFGFERTDCRSQTINTNNFCSNQRCANMNNGQIPDCNEMVSCNGKYVCQDLRQNVQQPCFKRVCCDCQQNPVSNEPETISNGLEQKRKAIEAREKQNNGNVVVEKDKENLISSSLKNDEPTVSDLYEIIKLQNQQLQILQQRVEKLLTVNESSPGFQEQCQKQQNPLTNVAHPNTVPSNDQVNVNCIEHISIGVMTSFELVMSSNYVNKRSVTFNPQVNCEKQKDECVQTTQNPANNQSPNDCGNFLDGIAPCNKACLANNDLNSPLRDNGNSERILVDNGVQTDFYTPKMSDGKNVLRKPAQLKGNSPIPEYNEDLYNETENECSQPNIGWTFYNNVMSRVNNMLHSPPSANSSPNTMPRGQFNAAPHQNVVPTNRVLPEPGWAPPPTGRHERPASELSLHMRQLACKYNIVPAASCAPQPPRGADARNEMSLATRQYMQRYHLLSVANDGHQQQFGLAAESYADYRPQQRLKPAYKNPSRILDITALKQQSKLL